MFCGDWANKGKEKLLLGHVLCWEKHMMHWGGGRCGGNNRCCGERKGQLSEPKCFSCVGRPFLLGQAISTAYHGHAKENLCKEVLAEVSFHWIYRVEMYSLAQYFQVKEACKTCCLKKSFISAFLVTKKVFGAKISDVMYCTSKAVKRLLTAL